MERNVGRLDRILRIVGGVLLVLVALGPFAGFVPVRTTSLVVFAIPGLLLLVGIVLLVTGATGRSLVYRFFGFETYSPDEEGERTEEEAAGGASER